MGGIVPADSDIAAVSRNARHLRDRIIGPEQPGVTPALPQPLPPFDISMLFPTGTDCIGQMGIRIGTGVFNDRLRPFHHSMEVLGIPGSDANMNVFFSLAYVLQLLLSDGFITLGEQYRGLGIGGTPPRAAGPYPWEALVSPIRSHVPPMLPLRLFNLKNGTPRDRDQFRGIQTAFTKLAPGRRFDIKFDAAALDAAIATPLGAGQVALPSATEQPPQTTHPGAVVTVVVDRTDPNGLHPNDLPVQLHGAGTWEALVMAEALVEADGRFVILDEPALTLHPTWQRALRSRIAESAGQFLVITHSANCVPMSDRADLSRLVRIDNETGASKPHRLPATLSNDEVSRITKDFAASADAVSLLFSRGVVLLEGATEQGALPIWFEKWAKSHQLPTPDDLDLAFYSVEGDTHFRTPLIVLHSLAIPWVVICDGAAFDIGTRRPASSHVLQQVLDAGVQSSELRSFMKDNRTTTMSKDLFDRERLLADRYGIFTLAHGWDTGGKLTGVANDESFESCLERLTPGQLARARVEVGSSKVRQGRWIARQTPCPTDVGDLYRLVLRGLQRNGLAPM